MSSEEGASIGAGSKIPILFDPDKIHVFDPETGRNIGLVE